MKVAVFTQPLHTNFGGTLQAFALQKTLKKLGHTPVTINFRWNTDNRSTLRNIAAFIKQKVTRSDLRFSFTSSELKKISVNHTKFIDKYISMSPAFYNADEIHAYFSSSDFDAVVVGSDQVWRPHYSPRIETYFLDFLSDNSTIVKLSYAASFGTDSWEFSEQQTLTARKLISSFNNVSVRESSAVELCRNKLSAEALHVLDPTLLLKKEDYLELIDASNSSNTGKLFNYVLDKSFFKNEIIDSICLTLSVNTFSTYAKISNKDKLFISDFNDYIYPDIERWIKSFYDASFIVTDSFHGTVFSIIFNKPFIAIANEERGKARFTSLLTLFGLENRLISNVSELADIELNEKINYEIVNDKLNELREESLKFISSSLVNY